MKYEIINIAQQYKDGNIDATTAMNTITTYLFPITDKNDVYIRRLVAFMWEVETTDILNEITKKYPISYAKIMYTKIIKDKYNCNSILLGQLCNIKANTARARLIAHDKYMVGYPEYKKIYNLINKVL